MLEVKTLGEICQLEKGSIQTGPFGSQLHQSDYTEVGIPVIMPADIIDGKVLEDRIARVDDNFADKLQRHTLEIGDIVFARRGDIGRQALITSREENWLCGTGCLKVNLGKKEIISPIFLHYYFKLPEVVDYLKNQAIGATMPNLNTEILKRIPIRYPSIENQNKIIGILSAYDELIENNKKRIALLETMAEELYKEWFVRFRFPNYENTEFEIGMPKNWHTELIKNLVDRKRFGKLFKEDEVSEKGNIPVYDQSRDNFFGFYNGEPEHKASFENPIIIFGDHTCKMKILFSDFSLAENVIPFKAKDNVNLNYLFYLIKDSVKTTEYKRHWTELTNKKVLIAPIELQNKFSEIIQGNLKMIDNLVHQNFKLAESRDSLLPRLISGNLSVENLDIQPPPTPATNQPTEPNTQG